MSISINDIYISLYIYIKIYTNMYASRSETGSTGTMHVELIKRTVSSARSVVHSVLDLSAKTNVQYIYIYIICMLVSKYAYIYT